MYGRTSLLALAALTLLTARSAEDAQAQGAPAAFVGGQTCVACHAREAKLWKGSHHDLAMQPADATTVLGNFDGASFTKDGVTSTFSRRDGKFFVRTDGPDGALHDYRVVYTFGVAPLQQYLIELPNGRYQALGIAWDTRPAAAGGQRWFDLYPQEKIDFRDVLHWTGPMQNWNFMCADCHSTNLQKNYRAADKRFETKWADIDVSCEACHGPGSRHVEWARDQQRGKTNGDPLRGLTFQLGDVSGGRWTFPPGQPIAQRTAPASHAEIETCGRCHARRAQIWETVRAGEPLAQAERISLLDPERYHADGQILDEVYEYGSFLQSKMFHAGVTCSDCHDPHSGALRAQGNAVCAQCHLPAKFDTAAHHFHQPGTAGAQCISCHMIERTYMVIDARRDHSFRVPRPDLTEKLGTPNACNDCHTDKAPGWAAEAIATRHGPDRAAQWHYGEALSAGATSRADAEAQLLRAAEDPNVPAIARATALSMLSSYPSPRSLPALQKGLADPDPLVRRAAVESVAVLPPHERMALGFPLLRDPVRSVRLEALGSLVDVPRSEWTREQLTVMDEAIAEYRQAQAFNADRAEANVNLGMLETRLANAAAAEAAFETAMRLQPSFVPAYVGLADLQRLQGREADAEAVLRRAVRIDPSAAEAHAALGLALVRQKKLSEALPELAKAAELRPDSARYAYVSAVALHDTGNVQGAIDVLMKAHERHPGARDLIVALVEYTAQSGNRDAAIGWAGKLVALSPDDPQARRLLETLSR